MAETTYNVYKASVLKGNEPWETGDYRVLLLTGALTIDADHATVAAVIAANTEASDASYDRVTLGTKTVTQNDTDDRAEADVATADFTTLDNETPTAALIFRQVTNDSDSIPVSIHDSNFGGASNGAGYTVSFPNDVLRAT